MGKFGIVVALELMAAVIMPPFALLEFTYLSGVYLSTICEHCEISLQIADIQSDFYAFFVVVDHTEHEPALVAVRIGVVFKIEIILILGHLRYKLEVGILIISLKFHRLLLVSSSCLFGHDERAF